MARPKSSTLTRPLSVTMTLEGLTSRWTMPCRWASASASRGLLGDVEHLVEVEPGLGELRERPARDVLHGDEAHRALATVELVDLVDDRDVRVVESRSGAGFAQQALAGLVVVHVGAQHLERHPAVQAQVLGQVDLAHAALAQALEESVSRGPLSAHPADIMRRCPAGHAASTAGRRTVRSGHVRHPAGRVTKRAEAAAWVAAFLLPLALYLPTLSYGFVFDDQPLIVRNPALEGAPRLFSYFTLDIDALRLDADQAGSSNYYRPLLMVALRGVKAVAGNDPRRWHATVAALHACVGLLAMALLVARGHGHGPALLVSLAFTAHPVHVDSVAWVSGIQDVWLGLTGLAAALAWETWRRRPSTGRLLLLAAAFAVALLSKEAALGLLLFAAGEAWWAGRRGDPEAGRAVRGLLVLAGVSLGYLALRLHVLGALARPLPSSAPPVLALASIPRVVLEYLRLTLLPLDLALLSPVRPVTAWISTEVLLALGLLGGVLVGAVLLARRWPDGFAPLLWFAAWLVPCLNLWALNREWVVMDRYLYLPALALPWLILAGTGPLRAGRFRLALLAALTLVYAGLSLAQMRTFRDERSFWARLLQADPRSSTALTEHARLLIEAGRRAEGRAELERAIQLAPDNLLPAFRLANLDLAEGRAAEAVERYARLIGRSPGYAPPWRNLPVALQRTGRAEEALQAARDAAARFPRDVEALLNLATLLRASGQLEQALATLRQARSVAPQEPRVALREALLLVEAGRRDEARTAVTRARPLSGERPYQAQLDALEALLRDQ